MLDGGMDADAVNVYTDGAGYAVTPLHFAAYKNKGKMR